MEDIPASSASVPVSDSSSATLTVRLIKSFEYKNYRNVVFHNVSLSDLNVGKVEGMVRERIAASPLLNRLFPTDSPMPLDTFKMYYQRHAAKTNNPIINIGEDEKLVLCDHTKSLDKLGFSHETEISFFNWDQYQTFINDPKFKWE